MLNKLMLFVSSYIPLYILLILKNVLERITDRGRFINVVREFNRKSLFNEVNDWAIGILILAILMSYLYLKITLAKDANPKWYVVREVSDETGNYYFNYISIYLLSCMGLSLNSIVDCFVFLFVMIIVGYIYISNNMMYLNPMIYMMGYKVFHCILDSKNTGDRELSSIVVVPKTVTVKHGEEIYASGKQGFIYLNKRKVRKA